MLGRNSFSESFGKSRVSSVRDRGRVLPSLSEARLSTVSLNAKSYPSFPHSSERFVYLYISFAFSTERVNSCRSDEYS